MSEFSFFHWLIVGTIVYIIYRIFRRAKRPESPEPLESSEPVGGKVETHATNFLPPIPKGFQIFRGRTSVAGIKYRRDDALRFADESDQTLALEREPNNAHDANAIKIIGVTRGARRFIGYVPKEIAEQIVGSNLADTVQPRLERIWRSETGFVDVMFQIVGPKERKAQYDDFLNSKPADTSQKEFLEFFGLSAPKGLTTAQATQMMAEHRKKLETENKAQLEEWNAYEEICDEFDDAGFRDSFDLKNVSRTSLKEALDALKREGATMRSLAADIDTVVAKVIALTPELEKK